MARARNIKPGFFKNEGLAELGAEAMLLFAGLWTLADRAGRMEDRPKRIKAEVFPYWPVVDVDSLLESLSASRFIVRYESSGSRYISIPAFEKHQNPHVKEAASTIPAPCEHRSNIGLAPEIPVQAPLIPSSLIPSSLIPSAAGKAGVVTMPSTADRLIAEAVLRMYTLHPKKKDMALVLDALTNAVAMEADPGAKLKEIEAVHAAWCETEGWTKKNGDFAPKLGDWITDLGFTKWPAGREPPKPRPVITQQWRPYDPKTLENLHERE